MQARVVHPSELGLQLLQYWEIEKALPQNIQQRQFGGSLKRQWALPLRLHLQQVYQVHLHHQRLSGEPSFQIKQFKRNHLLQAQNNRLYPCNGQVQK